MQLLESTLSFLGKAIPKFCSCMLIWGQVSIILYRILVSLDPVVRLLFSGLNLILLD